MLPAQRAGKKSSVQGAIGFGFASHWWKNRGDIFKPINKRSNRNHVITFNGHLKTALIGYLPFTKNFRKFRLEFKWYKAILVFSKKFQNFRTC